MKTSIPLTFDKLSSKEINTMVLHFLRETGMIHSSFCFEHEAMVNWNRQLTPGRLQSLVEKGYILEKLEEETRNAFKKKNKDIFLYSKRRKTRTRSMAKEDKKPKEEVLDLKNYISSRIQIELLNIKEQSKQEKKKNKIKEEEQSRTRNLLTISEPRTQIKKFFNQGNNILTQNLNFGSKDLKKFMPSQMLWSQEFTKEQMKSSEGGSLKDLGIHLQINALGNKKKDKV